MTTLFTYNKAFFHLVWSNVELLHNNLKADNYVST